MDVPTVATFLSKLSLEDDESDIIRFGFVDDNRKIRCSKSFLSKISPVFQKMFSKTWLKKSTIHLNDKVVFDEYSTFKLFLEIVYDICDVNFLSINQLTAAYYYVHKYEVMIADTKIQTQLNIRIDEKQFSLDELASLLQFAELYQLKDFKKNLDHVSPTLNDANPVEFFQLAEKFQMEPLKNKVIDYLKIIEPNDTWTLEMSNSVVRCLQRENKENEEKIKILSEQETHVYKLERGSRYNLPMTDSEYILGYRE